MPEDAPDEWFLQPDPFAIDINRVERFIECTEALLVQLQELVLNEAEPASPQYMTLVYDAAKETFDHDRTQLRTYFAWLYLVVFQRDEGPRWGDFIDVYGVDNFVSHVRSRFASLLGV